MATNLPARSPLRQTDYRQRNGPPDDEEDKGGNDSDGPPEDGGPPNGDGPPGNGQNSIGQQANSDAWRADGDVGQTVAGESDTETTDAEISSQTEGSTTQTTEVRDSSSVDGQPSELNDDDTVQVGSDVLKLDGDWLPDRYEENVLGTSPLNPDSDSRFTDADEADMGVIDGKKDFSGDGLTAYQEYQLGTDPLVKDTSGDGLEDGFQVLRAGTDPLVNDTDGDGVPDAEEDLSGDGLTLIEEQEQGTNPLVNDTDADGLTDYEEVYEYDTDPLDPDTDGDGLPDGDEIQVGTDPMVDDVEPNETFTSTTVDEESGVEVTGTGEGAVADDI